MDCSRKFFSKASGGASSGGTAGGDSGSDSSNIDYSGSLSSIIGNIVGIAEKITSIPQQLAEKLGLDALFSALSDKVAAVRDGVLSIPETLRGYIMDLQDAILEKQQFIVDGILNAPEKIGDAIAGLFLPSDSFIEGKIEHFREKLLGMGVDTYDMGAIFNREQPFADITCTIRGQTVTIVRMEFVDSAVKKFRPVIRGFIWLMLLFYNFNQFMHFIGQEGMTLGGIVRTADAKQKGGSDG